MLCYSLYCLFLALCTLKWRDNGLQENESTNYATKRHKKHNHGSIIKLLNLKKLKSIIMHSTLENYIFFTYLLYVSRSIVYSIIFLNLNIFDYRILLEKLRSWTFCFFCWHEFVLVARFNGIKLKLHVIMGYFWNINSKTIHKKCKQFYKKRVRWLLTKFKYYLVIQSLEKLSNL